MHSSTSVQTPALRSVGNIVTGDDLQTQVVIASGALPALLSLLSSPKDGIRKEACWTISNITAGNSTQIQAVIDANIIAPLIALIMVTTQHHVGVMALPHSDINGDDGQELVKRGVLSWSAVASAVEILKAGELRCVALRYVLGSVPTL